MSEPSVGGDLVSAVEGALAVGAIGVIYKAVTGLFTRNLGAADKALGEMRNDVKDILTELRSMHDEQIRQRGDITTLNKDVAKALAEAEAANSRVDDLVSAPPRPTVSHRRRAR